MAIPAVTFPGGKPRVVHQDGFGAYKNGVDQAAQPMVVGERFRAGDPLAGPVRGRDPAVQGLGNVERDEGAPGLHRIEPFAVQIEGLGGGKSGPHVHTGSAKPARTSCGWIVGIIHGVNDP